MTDAASPSLPSCADAAREPGRHDAAVARFFDPAGPFAAVIDGYRMRPLQVAMSQAIAEAIEKGETLVAEAGTGVGKSLAYLVPAARFALGQRVMVAEDVNLRVEPGLGAGVIEVLPAGTDGTVIGGPVDVDGFTWWQVETGAGMGWAVEDWLA